MDKHRLDNDNNWNGELKDQKTNGLGDKLIRSGTQLDILQRGGGGKGQIVRE